MIENHKNAQEEVVKNSIIAAKRTSAAAIAAVATSDSTATLAGDADAYKEWLRTCMPGDYENEFVTGIRANEKLHVLWDSTPGSASLTHIYTTASNSLDPDMVDREVASTKKGLTAAAVAGEQFHRNTPPQLPCQALDIPADVVPECDAQPVVEGASAAKEQNQQVEERQQQQQQQQQPQQQRQQPQQQRQQQQQQQQPSIEELQKKFLALKQPPRTTQDEQQTQHEGMEVGTLSGKQLFRASVPAPLHQAVSCSQPGLEPEPVLAAEVQRPESEPEPGLELQVDLAQLEVPERKSQVEIGGSPVQVLVHYRQQQQQQQEENVEKEAVVDSQPKTPAPLSRPKNITRKQSGVSYANIAEHECGSLPLEPEPESKPAEIGKERAEFGLSDEGDLEDWVEPDGIATSVPTTAPMQPSARVGVLEIYENERRIPLLGKKSNTQAQDAEFHWSRLLPTDRPRWSDERGRLAAFDTPSWPGHGMEWVDKEWQVVVEAGITDAEGWEYAFNFGRKFSSSRGGALRDPRWVRRRRWQRRVTRSILLDQ